MGTRTPGSTLPGLRSLPWRDQPSSVWKEISVSGPKPLTLSTIHKETLSASPEVRLKMVVPWPVDKNILLSLFRER